MLPKSWGGGGESIAKSFFSCTITLEHEREEDSPLFFSLTFGLHPRGRNERKDQLFCLFYYDHSMILIIAEGSCL